MKALVIYHDDADGFCSAWIFKKFGMVETYDAEFWSIQYGEPPPDVTGRRVYILDFSFKRDILEGLNQKAEYLKVLDHHKTAQDELAGLLYCVFDINKCGARLTWEEIRIGTAPHPEPWMLQYVEDRDLGRMWGPNPLPNSAEVSAAIASYPRTFEAWDELDAAGPKAAIADGKAILRYQDRVVEAAVKNAWETELDGHKVLCVNATCLISETAHELAKGRPFGMVWFQAKDRTVYSLRSTKDGVDVSEIAKKFGGGGHKNAAGFSWKGELCPSCGLVKP